MKKDNGLIVSQSSFSIPSLEESEEEIRKDAPDALKTLNKLGGLDVSEILLGFELVESLGLHKPVSDSERVAIQLPKLTDPSTWYNHSTESEK